MATLGRTMLGLVDLYNQTDAKNNYTPVIEMLAEMTPILDDAIAIECNNGTSHKHTIRTGLPTVTWGMLYRGIPDSKSRTAQVQDTTGFVEGKSVVDMRVLKLAGKNADNLRLSEAQSHIEAMSQEVSTKIFYGNTAVDPEEFMGFGPRFNSIAAANGRQIVDAGGTGNVNTSAWFITWGDNYCHLLYPQGTKAGIEREDLGPQKQLDGANGSYMAKEEVFTWHVGLAVKDWRYVVRVANLDVPALEALTSDVYGFFRTAYYRLQSTRIAGGRQAIYMNRAVLEAMDAIASNAGATDNFIRLKTTEVEGKMINSYRGIPIRDTDSLINTEARIT